MSTATKSKSYSRRPAGVLLLVGVLAGVAIGGGVGVHAASPTTSVPAPCDYRCLNALIEVWGGAAGKNGAPTNSQTQNICGPNGATACAIGLKGPGGGIVFMTPSTPGNTSGMFYEAAPSTWSSSSRDPFSAWCNNSNTLLGVPDIKDDSGAMDGAARTTVMLGVCTSGAANLAHAYRATVNGVVYRDWFLPSKGELNQMFVNKVATSDFGVGIYWSSSELDAGNAWVQFFDMGSRNVNFKSKGYYVRPVRTFAVRNGAAGTAGTAGAKGDTGAKGAAGAAGAKGETGLRGFTGAKGAAGSNGAAGAKGDTGTAGSNGAAGAKGDTGTAGSNGAAGAKGDTGTTGANGAHANSQIKNICGDNGITTCALGLKGPGGGVVFATPSTLGNTSGLFYEAAPSTWSSPSGDPYSVWCNNNNTVLGIASTVAGKGAMDGSAKTTVMLGVCTSGAANLVDAYTATVNGVVYGDWFLPSKGELNQMHILRATLGNFNEDYYWSSSENAAANAWVQLFSGDFDVTGYGIKSGASGNFSVRPVRAF